jgi:hypothetical protein
MSSTVQKRVEEVLADHATTFHDEDGDLRCECGKWLEPGEHEWPKHVSWMLDDAGLLADGGTPA